MKSLVVCETSLIDQKTESALKDKANKKMYSSKKCKPEPVINGTEGKAKISDAADKSLASNKTDPGNESKSNAREASKLNGKDAGDKSKNGSKFEPEIIDVESSENGSQETEQSDCLEIILVKDNCVSKEEKVKENSSKMKEEKNAMEDELKIESVLLNEDEKSARGCRKEKDSAAEKHDAIRMESPEEVKPVAGEKMLVDVDENKENEKVSERPPGDSLFSGGAKDDSVDSSRCDVQVSDRQTVATAEKETCWNKTESDNKTSESTPKTGERTEDTKKKRLARPMPKSKKLSLLQEEGQKNEEKVGEDLGKSKSAAFDGGEADTSRNSGSDSNGGNNKIDGSDEGMVSNLKRSADNDESIREKKRTRETRQSVANLKKRQVEEVSESKSAKKKKLDSKKVKGESEEENRNGHESSPAEGSVLAKKGENSSSSSPVPNDEVKPALVACEVTKSCSSPPVSEPAEDSKSVDLKAGETTASILAGLRGTLKSLTRSDLEELIVQKLCEVVTERSTVGELRRKAQALEQDQEKWRTKVQVLSKQVKEMEMVMKKYLSEVHKQMKEGTNQVVMPLKVTRSVGLQVSFYSSGNKTPKQNPPQVSPSTSSSGSNGTPKGVKAIAPKTTPQPGVGVSSPQARNKGGTPGTPGQKVVTPQKTPSGGQNSKMAVNISRGDFLSSSVQPQRPSVPQLIAPKQSPNQVVRTRHQDSGKLNTVNQIPPPASSQQHNMLQQQNGSKVIDLTDDDDRQLTSVGTLVKPATTLRVVNPPTPSQLPTNNRITYLLPAPAAATATATSNGQNVQVLITSPTIGPPNRPPQQLVSMPPLLFKGGNPAQTVSPIPAQVLTPGPRVICPKPPKHPAPLPPQPVSLYQKPNAKLLPPRPALKISKVQTGIVLSWNMSLSADHAPISSYQLYAYQEGNAPPATSLWKKVGDVKALPLPMACTLTQFMSGHKYHFAVRAVDHHSRVGPFSYPGTIVLYK